MDKTSFEVTVSPPYNFNLQWKLYSAEEPQPETYKNGILRRAFKIGSKLIPVDVNSIGTTRYPKLRVNVFSNLTPNKKRLLLEIVKYFFSLEDNFNGLYKFMDRDDVLCKIKNKLYGLRPPKMGINTFEGVIRSIIQQQISLRVAQRINSALIKTFGEKSDIGGEIYYDFPPPDKLAKASLGKLRKCKLSQQKSRYVKNFSIQVAGGYDLEGIKKMSDKDAIDELMKFDGIGRWSAELVLVATLGRRNLSVPNDLGERRAISYFYFSGEMQSAETIREFEKQWDKYKGWISYYLMYGFRLLKMDGEIND